MELKYLNWSILKIKFSKPVLLLLVLTIFLILRIWLLPQTINFAWDQERDATVVSKIITNHVFPLIGPRVVGDHGFFLGPYFFYLLTPFYVLSGLHPYAIIYFLVFFSLIFFSLAFIALNKIINFKTAVIFLSIWAVLPLTITQDRIAWNPCLIPFGFFIILFFLSRFKPLSKNFLILGVILGLFFHFHFQSLFYLIFVLAYLIIRYPRSILKLIWLFIGFGLTFAPLLIFDLRHQWLNFNLFQNFFFSSPNTTHSLTAFLPVWVNFVKQISGIDNIIFSILFWFVLIIYGYVNRHQKYFLPATLIIFITPIAFALYGQRPSEYYFNYLLPIIILFLAHFISRLKISPYFIGLILIAISINSFVSLKTNPSSLFYKNNIVKTAKSILKDNPVFISYETPLGENNGFDYLINYYKINRSLDPLRPMVQFVIPKRNSFPTFGNISLILPQIIQ